MALDPSRDRARGRGRHPPSTPLVFKVTSVVYNPPFQKFLDPPLTAFSNWWLKCKDERINLGLVRTLRNRSDKATKDKFRKLIPKNDLDK